MINKVTETDNNQQWCKLTVRETAELAFTYLEFNVSCVWTK